MAHVTFTAVSKRYDDAVALERLDLSIREGEFVALLGPSGCGKSTLLRLVAGLDKQQGGEVIVGNHAVSLAGKKRGAVHGSNGAAGRDAIAFVFQDAHLLPWRNVLRNVALPLELRGVSKAERLAAASHAIEQVGLADASRRYPAQLSGGMKMRVSLARALITRPRIILLDEPFAALDEMTRQRLDEQLYELWRATGMTVLFVTHSISEAVYLAQRAIVFSKRPARVTSDVRIDLPIHRNASTRTDARFNPIVRDLFVRLEREGA